MFTSKADSSNSLLQLSTGNPHASAVVTMSSTQPVGSTDVPVPYTRWPGSETGRHPPPPSGSIR